MKAQHNRSLLRDCWLRRKFLVEWTKGLGTQIGFCCLMNTVILLTIQLWSDQRVGGTMALFAGFSFLGSVICIAGDAYWCQRRCYFPLLRRVVHRCEQRMRRMHVNSPAIERFIHDVLFSSRTETTYRAGAARSLRAIIEALDRLCCAAERYGGIGKHVFAVNEGPIVRSLRLLESLPAEVGDDVALIPLLVWLEPVPEYDPEGWSLSKDVTAEQVRMLYEN